MLENTFCRKFLLSHHFVENIVANPKYILQNWRIFLFLRDPSTKYISLCAQVLQNERDMCILTAYVLRLCKTLFYTSFCRAYCEQLEQKFRKLREVYRTNIFIYNNLFHILHIFYGLRNKNISLDLKFAELLEHNAQRKEAVSDLDASSSTK